MCGIAGFVDFSRDTTGKMLRQIAVHGRDESRLKGHPAFLRAAARLAQTRPDIRFACIGDEPDRCRQTLECKARELGSSGQLK